MSYADLIFLNFMIPSCAGHARLLHDPLRVLRVSSPADKAAGVPGPEDRSAPTVEAADVDQPPRDDSEVNSQTLNPLKWLAGKARS